MLRNVKTPIFLQKKSLSHFHFTRIYQFGLLTGRNVEVLPQLRDGFLKKIEIDKVLPIQVTDYVTDILENCAVWDLVQR
jgi:hypothetical protein